MQDALKKLARRGTPRGFDHVLAAAASESSASNRVDDAAGDDAADLDPIPFVSTEPVARRRRPLGSMIAAAGIAALVLVGAFAVSAVVGGGGGSNSPEGAVRQLADAISHEDPLSAADVLAPDEVRSLHGTLDAAAQKAKELALVQTAGAPLSGVDFNISNLGLSTESLGDGYAKVTVNTGTFTASTHKTQFSPLMQKVLRNAHDNSAESDLAQLAGSHQLPTFVVAVRQDGKWYVSAAYTTLEYIREWNNLPAADFGSGQRAASTLGADSPDAAVQDAMRALQSENWSKLMTLAPPDEIPFYDYRAAFSELIRREQADATTQPTSGFTIDAMKTSAQVDGDTAKVTLVASGKIKHGTWSLDGGCYKATSNEASDQGVQFPYTCGELGGFGFSLVLFPLSGVDQSTQFTVVQRDGRWFVSPVGSILDVIDHAISKLDQRSVYSLLNVPDRIPADGALVLGKPIVLSGSTLATAGRVLSFDGHKGEQLLGLATSKSTPKSTPVEFADEIPASARVFAPDGSELKDASNMLSGHALTLPADGTYKFVLQMQIFGLDPGDVTVTVWDAGDAPADAKKDRGMSSCDYTGLFMSECSSMSSSSSGFSGPNDTVSPGSCTSTPGGGESCTYEGGTNGELGLNGTTGTAPVAPTIEPLTNPPTSVSSASVAGSGKSSSATSSVPHG